MLFRSHARDYRTFVPRDTEKYKRFAAALQDRGVRVVPEGIWFVSTAHTDADVDQTLAAVAEAAKGMA